MEKDIIETIRFKSGKINIGSLVFTYLQDIEQAGDEFIEPAMLERPEIPTRTGPGILWLVDLAQKNLGK